MTLMVNSIAEILGAVAGAGGDRTITTLLTDSRSLVDAAGSMFFALRTPSGNGHSYIGSLYDAGVRAFVVEREWDGMLPDDAAVIRVESPAEALLAIGHAIRNDLRCPVIGITGSRGKTIVKEWLYALLRPDYRIARSPRSFNSHIGVPLSLCETEPETTLAIFEAGVSQAGDMDSIAPLICPAIGVLTNITGEHNEGFASREDKIAEKLKLFEGAEKIIYCVDNALVDHAVKEKFDASRLLGWSACGNPAELQIAVTAEGSRSKIDYTFGGSSGSVTVPVTSAHQVENAVTCLAVMLALEIPGDIIADRMAGLEPVGTRLDVIEGINGSVLVSDSFTCDHHSLAPALDFMLRRRIPGQRTTVILSDVIPEGESSEELYNRVGATLRQWGIDRIIGIGEEISRHAEALGAETYASTEEFLNRVPAASLRNELILIKGAPKFRFEKITERLERHQHETVLEVNLDAMVRNLNFFRSRLEPSTAIVCMVKAFGYGAGSYELAKTLQSQGADYLAVAAHDEGVELRRAGITMPIMVLNPKVMDYGALFDYNLEPEIYSIDILNDIIAEASRRSLKDYPVHIKLDTGMHRLGFLEDELPAVIETVRGQEAVSIRSVFSHLCCADDPADDDYTRGQFALFERCCELIQSAFPHRILRHILNSAGALRFPEKQYDMVRLGIGLYGINVVPESEGRLERVSSLHSVIIAIRDWPAGTTIGYNRRGRLDRASRIATIPIGYADGIDRHLGYGNMTVSVNGHACPTVGSVCMDVMMVDVTDAPCNIGDRVELFGNAVPTESVAEALTTIPYEVLTSVSRRVKRVYFRE